MLPISVEHLPINQLVLDELTLAVSPIHESQLSLPMHLEVLVYFTFVGSALGEGYRYWAHWPLVVPSTTESAVVDQEGSIAPFLAHFEGADESVSWWFDDNTGAVPPPQKPLSFVNAAI